MVEEDFKEVLGVCLICNFWKAEVSVEVTDRFFQEIEVSVLHDVGLSGQIENTLVLFLQRLFSWAVLLSILHPVDREEVTEA